MSEKTVESEVPIFPYQMDDKEKSRGEGEGEEENVAAFLVLKPEQMQEDGVEPAEDQGAASKNKPGKVQSVFCLVRDQIRGQPGREASRTGMLQLVHQVTRQMDRTKVEQRGFENTSPRKEVLESLEGHKETTVDLENVQTQEESKMGECMVLLQQILSSIEGLRKEVGDELKLLRQEVRSNTDKVLRELETRVTQNNANTNTQVPVPLNQGAPKRRILRRTLTTVAPKTSTTQAFRPRCMSEPVGGRDVENASTANGTLRMSNLEQLLPPVVITQHAKKPVRPKMRMNKP